MQNKDFGFEVTGIEISPDQLKIGRRKEKPDVLSFIEGDAQDIPFPDGYFDKGVIFGALHEMPREVRRNVLSEAYRAIRPEGKIVIFEQNKPERKWNLYSAPHEHWVCAVFDLEKWHFLALFGRKNDYLDSMPKRVKM